MKSITPKPSCLETRQSTFNILLRAGAVHLWHPGVVDDVLNLHDTPPSSMAEVLANPEIQLAFALRCRLSRSLASVAESGHTLESVLSSGHECYANAFLAGVRYSLVGSIEHDGLNEEVQEIIRHRFHLMIGNFAPGAILPSGEVVTYGFKAYLERYLALKCLKPVLGTIRRHALLASVRETLHRTRADSQAAARGRMSIGQ